MLRSYRWSIAVAAALAVGAPASAQQFLADDIGVTATAPSTQASSPVAASAAFVPTVTLASAMVVEPTSATFVAPMPAVMRQSQSVAMMIVGGAGLIVGSLIDGDTGTIVMVGGGVVGLIGLFQYLR